MAALPLLIMAVNANKTRLADRKPALDYRR